MGVINTHPLQPYAVASFYMAFITFRDDNDGNSSSIPSCGNKIKSSQVTSNSEENVNYTIIFSYSYAS